MLKRMSMSAIDAVRGELLAWETLEPDKDLETLIEIAIAIGDVREDMSPCEVIGALTASYQRRVEQAGTFTVSPRWRPEDPEA